MSSHPPRKRRLLAGAVLTAAAVTAFTAGAAAPSVAAPGHTGVPATVPSVLSPNILDGSVRAIYDNGTKVVAVGNFTQVQNRNTSAKLNRLNIVSFDKATGVVDTAFAPVLDDIAYAVVAGPTPGTVLVGGKFNTVNGQNSRKLALLNLADGSLVAGFKSPAFNGLVMDVVKAGNRYLVGGTFTVAGGQTRSGLASVDAVTGTLDPYLTNALTVNHNWTGAPGQIRAAVGAEKLALSPDGATLLVIGNFKYADGVLHDQVVKLNLGDAVTVSPWNTDRYQAACAPAYFDSYVRDVAYSPDGSYFVIATTGAGFAGTLCDSTARWEAASTVPNAQPTWVAYSGGDTFLSAAVTEQAVYVGGHFRWLNNTLGNEAAAHGAVARPSIAALDPQNGLPLKWNPGRSPRGYGVTDITATPDGIWLGYDTKTMGNAEHRRERIAFMPMAGGGTPHATNVGQLPGRVYTPGDTNVATVRTFDGRTAGAPAAYNNPAMQWSLIRGCFWVGGELYYSIGTTLARRTFDGTTFGPASVVNPYSDPVWDSVLTQSGPKGQTYRGMSTGFYVEIGNVTGMTYANGRLYYTLAGNQGLFWRWFSPDSGIVGAERFQVPGASGFLYAGGMFVSGTRIYVSSRQNGGLFVWDWNNGAPGANPVQISGPTIDGQNWLGRSLFVAP